MNKIYTIEITETLQKQVKIKANSQEEAEKKVRRTISKIIENLIHYD